VLPGGVDPEPAGEFQFSIWLSNCAKPLSNQNPLRSDTTDGTWCSSHLRGESGQGAVGSVTIVPPLPSLVTTKLSEV
jgi:hypothetical protein